MRHTKSVRLAILLSCLVLADGDTTAQPLQLVEIVITTGGRNAKFVKTGDGEQKPVEVVVGQSVRWKNTDGEQHTARSIKNGKTLFDTRYIDPGQSKDWLFDADLYRNAGGDGTNPVEIDYECQVHNTMRARIVLKPAPGTTPVQPGRQPGGERVFDAVTEGANFIWKPNVLYGAKAGDLIVWKIANVPTPGQHNLKFNNWAKDKELFEVLGTEAQFDTTKGESQLTAQPNTVLLRARLKAAPAPGAPILFHCPNHGEAMSGQLTARERLDEPGREPVDATPIFTTPTALIAAFDMVKITDRKNDSYYAIACDLNTDGKPDLVTSGLGEPGRVLAEVAWYENPSWKKRVIGHFDVPVALDAADVDGDGLLDLAITYDYGSCIFNCRPGSGLVAWLQNPGKTEIETEWKRFPIGKHLASHRLRFGHFTQLKTLELLSVPVVGGAEGRINDPIQIKVFTRPNDVLNAAGWREVVVNDSLSVIHEIEVRKFGKASGSKLDSVLAASAEGITWLSAGPDKKWSAVSIGAGERGQLGMSPARWKGSGSVDAGRVGSDSLAYIAATEPFHGNLLTLYTKDLTHSLDRLRWRRRVIDVIGPISNRGEGPGHHVKTIDVDRDGRDELLVGLRGPSPNTGVHIYRIDDLPTGKVSRQQVSPISAAEIIVADFDGDGRMDFVTIPYRVSSYVVADNTEAMLFLNRTPSHKPKSPAPKN